MFAAIVIYIGVGLVVGALARFTKSETSTLAGMLGSGGVAGLVGGLVANLLFSDEIEVDVAGLVGSIILALVVVLVVRAADRRRAIEAQPAPESETPAPESETDGTDD